MPDIEMCQKSECKKRESCYRYRAVPSDPHQWYSEFDPKACGSYMAIEPEGYYRVRGMGEIEKGCSCITIKRVKKA